MARRGRGRSGDRALARTSRTTLRPPPRATATRAPTHQAVTGCTGRSPASTPPHDRVARLGLAFAVSSAICHLQVSFEAAPSSHNKAALDRARLHRHQSFDPRMARREADGSPHRRQGSPAGTGSGAAGSSRAARSEAEGEAAWAKLVSRAQALEDELASERASKRLSAMRHERALAEIEGRLARSEEDRDGLRRLWHSSHARIDEVRRQLALRYAEWDAERHALYAELARLRDALRDAGGTSPSTPPAATTTVTPSRKPAPIDPDATLRGRCALSPPPTLLLL